MVGFKYVLWYSSKKLIICSLQSAVGITTQWFNRRRGFAMRLASSGSGIGGLVLPFILTPLNNSLGIGW